MSTNTYTTDAKGNKIYLCNYRWVDPDGRVETCRAHKACEVCGQCSRIDSAGHEGGHCPGHLGLNEHIIVPGMDGAKVRENAVKARPNRTNQHKRPNKQGPKVERRPSFKKA